MAYGVLLPHRVHLVNGLPMRDVRDLPVTWEIQQELGYVWEKSGFTVPANVPNERVQFKGEHFRRKFGDYLVAKGFTVIKMEGPVEDHGLLATGTTAPDRRAYVIYAKVTRRPIVVRVDVLDEDVPIYQQSDFRLV